MKLKAAILQTKVYTEKEKNILQLERILAAGQTEGADLVTLPEMFACPYETGNFPMYAEAEGGPSWQALSSLAKQHSIYSSISMLREDRALKSRIHSPQEKRSAVLIQRLGKSVCVSVMISVFRRQPA